MAWQHAVDQALSTLDLTHTRFLVLLGAALATAEMGDAVTQQCIADAAGLDKVTTSRLVNRLGAEGLLDKNIHGLDDRKLRIYVTRTGRLRLERACALVDEAAASFGPVRYPEARPRPG